MTTALATVPRGFSDAEGIPRQPFPAGIEGITARFVELKSGLRVRIVESGTREAGMGGGRGEGERNGGGRGERETTVLLPGWGCSAYAYRKNVRSLAALGMRVVIVELKGQGLSDKPVGDGEYTIESLTSHTLEILDALRLSSVSIVGHSLGGLVAVRVALAAPRRVRRLALLDPVGFGRVRLVGIARLLPAALAPLLPRLAGRRWLFALALRSAYGSLARPSARDVDEYFVPASDPAFVRSLWSLLREVDWRKLAPTDVRRLAMPLLVVFGSEDRLILPRGVESLASEAPMARTVLIPGAGHACAEEAPDEVNAVLAEFLR